MLRWKGPSHRLMQLPSPWPRRLVDGVEGGVHPRCLAALGEILLERLINCQLFLLDWVLQRLLLHHGAGGDILCLCNPKVFVAAAWGIAFPIRIVRN